MPFACPSSLTRRVGQASVHSHVACLTELRRPSYPVLPFSTRHRHVTRSFCGHSSTPTNVIYLTACSSHRSTPTWSYQLRSYSKSRRVTTHSSALESDTTPSLREVLSVASRKRITCPPYSNQLDVSESNTATDSSIYVGEDDVSESSTATDSSIYVGEDDATDHSHPSDNYSLNSPQPASELQPILSRHIIQVVKQTGHDPSSIITTIQDEKTLARHGYNVQDLRTWTTILLSTDSLHAARLLTTVSAPPFVYPHLLRRRLITADALHLLVEHLPVWHKRMLASNTRGRDKETGHGFPDSPMDSASTQDSSTTADDSILDHSRHQSLLFQASIRLFRHARHVCPQVLVNITHFLVSFLCLSPTAASAIENGEAPTRQLSTITKLFNQALYLIAKPIAVQPFKDAVHQETAQATILRHMAEHNPPLAIDRRGYRGVMRVQLLHKKTPDEAEWARLKSPSWPPWKEDRTGMDANVGLEYGVSRGRHIINRMQEAGYPMKEWERTAQIYTGWDSDMSPTIQTRAVMPEPTKSDRETTSYLWAARIRSTRTVQQAWACFLSYEDEGLDPHQNVYHAMFEKLVEERQRQTLGDRHPTKSSDHDDGLDFLYPGDLKEIFPPPTSVHQATYTKTPPPSIDELHQHMLKSQIPPTRHTLAFLINNSVSLGTGLKYLESSGHSQSYDLLIKQDLKRGSLDRVPASVFAAVVGLLSRFPHTALSRRDQEVRSYKYGAWDLDLSQPLGRAIGLLDKQRPQHHLPWNGLLRGLARPHPPTVFNNWRRVHVDRAVDSSPEAEKEAPDRIVAYRIARHTVEVMRSTDITLDSVGFILFCRLIESTARASCHFTALYADIDESKMNNAERMLLNGARKILGEASFLKQQFYTLVGSPKSKEKTSSSPSTPASSSLLASPRLLTTPNPAILHAYIRALGFLKDYNGLLTIIRWMRTYWAELRERKEIDRNGEVVFRRCIVALRIFLEGRWEADHPLQQSNQESEDGVEQVAMEPRKSEDSAGNDAMSVGVGAPIDVLDKAREMVDGIEEWDGWAEDEEVESYMTRM